MVRRDGALTTTWGTASGVVRTAWTGEDERLGNAGDAGSEDDTNDTNEASEAGDTNNADDTNGTTTRSARTTRTAWTTRTNETNETNDTNGTNDLGSTNETNDTNDTNDTNETNDTNDTNVVRLRGSGQGHPREAIRGLSDTYVREVPLAVASPILWQMGSRAGRRRVRWSQSPKRVSQQTSRKQEISKANKADDKR